MEKRCYECMEPITDGEVCPKCGFNNAEFSDKIADFKGGALLKSRYYLGNIFSKTLDSTVYIAYDEELNKKVFVREFTGEGIAKISSKHTTTELRQKFLTYAKSTATLNMCNILPHTVDAFDENEACYLVTDHFEGENLKTLLGSGIKISSSNALKMAKQLLKGLEPIHNAGLIFGAISPETLYILKNGEVRIFGLASRFYDFTEELDCRIELLNPSYAAPELFEENGVIGTQCDVYSVAAILYRILTNTIPAIGFLRSGGENLTSPRKINKKIAKNTSKALLNALNWQIKSRTATVGAFLDELSAKKVKRIRSGAIILANVLGLFQRIYDKLASRKGKKRNLLWLWITIPTVILIGLIILLIFLFPGTKSNNDNSSSSSATSDDGWYYGSGIETPVSSNDYIYGGYNSDKPSSSRDNDSDKKNSRPSSTNSALLDPNSLECPDLAGYTLDQAKNILENSGLLLGNVTYKYSNEYPENYVMAQSLKSGGIVKKGTKINLIVCKGTEIELPDVSGLDMNKAAEKLAEAGFSNIEYKFVLSDDVPGTVTEAYFEDETNQTTSSKVIISVSGEQIAPIANFESETVAAVKEKYPDINFVFIDVNGATLSNISNPEAYTVVGQDIPEHSYAYKGITVTLTVTPSAG